MKLIVMIVGLVALVPMKGDDAVVLLPDASRGAEFEIHRSCTAKADSHSAEVVYLHSDGKWKPEQLKGDLSFMMPGEQKRSLESMIDLTRFLDSLQPVVVKKSCVEWATDIASSDCGAVARVWLSGGVLTSGDVRLAKRDFGGTSRVVGDSPIGLTFQREFQGVILGARQFDEAGDPQDLGSYMSEGSNALLFEIDVPRNFQLFYDGTLHEMKASDNETCASLGQDPGCYFVQVRNIPETYFDASLADRVPTTGDTDYHFGLLYGLLPVAPEPIRFPVTRIVMPGATSGHPSIKCPNGKVEPPEQ